MQKNVAGQKIAFQAISSTDGSAVTSGTPTVYVTVDAGIQGAGGGSTSHEGNGCWTYAPTQAETNGDHVVFTFTLTGAINQSVNVYPGDVSYLNTRIETRLAASSYAAPLDAAGTRTALGLASANLDAQLAALPTAGGIADAVWDELFTGHAVPNSFGEAVVVGANNAALAASYANVVMTDWSDGGRLDVLLDAAKDNATTAVARLPTALVSGRMDANVGAMATDTISAAAVSAAAVTKIAAGVPTTGLKLAADGLDQISAANPTGAGTTFAEKMMRLYHRFFAKHRKTGNSIIVYRDDGTTPATTQAYTVVGDTETVEPPA